uniref:Alternative protein ENPP4 n=1 Tax=Homo sapiens TaxID=9606 RepID=L8ECF4_HUMAN|nr:alternative protein ENPP4 [Homo sapiens]
MFVQSQGFIVKNCHPAFASWYLLVIKINMKKLGCDRLDYI